MSLEFDEGVDHRRGLPGAPATANLPWISNVDAEAIAGAHSPPHVAFWRPSCATDQLPYAARR